MPRTNKVAYSQVKLFLKGLRGPARWAAWYSAMASDGTIVAGGSHGYGASRSFDTKPEAIAWAKRQAQKHGANRLRVEEYGLIYLAGFRNAKRYTVNV
jgi:hypothetical protein